MTINTEVKGQLARLLATENLIVEHRPVSTAQFNVQTRVLTLPMWKSASQDVYDLLVGHEVGHALYTPNIDWREDDRNKGLPMSFINVTEDARIEKLMKRKFPGLSRNFINGYRELNEQDFFGIADDDLEEMTLIDRINLHFKIGLSSIKTIIPFSSEEDELVEQVAAAETFEDALAAARAVYEYQKESPEYQEQVEIELDEDVSQDGSGDMEMESSSEIDEEEDGESSASGDNNGESDDGAKSQSTSPRDGGEPARPSTAGSGNLGDMESKTDASLKEKLEQMASNASYEAPIYVELPSVNVEEYIFPLEQFHKDMTKFYKEIVKKGSAQDDTTYRHWQHTQALESYKRHVESFQNFRRDSQKEVNYMVKEFEMRKSADSYSRAATSRTGILNMNKLHTYKWNEDLFKKITVLPGDKNHGMIFILDWSGSMSNTIASCVRQVITMCWFCRKVGIPFEVYAFTCNIPSHVYTTRQHIQKTMNVVDIEDYTCLINLLSSKVNNTAFESHAQHLYIMSNSFNDYNDCLAVPNMYGLSGTPLNQVICLYNDLINHFQQKYRTQKMNLITLTDGEDGGIGFHRYYENHDRWGHGGFTPKVSLRNRKNGRVYAPAKNHIEITKNFLRYVQDSHPEVKFIGIRMCGSEAKGYIRSVEDEELVTQSITNWEKEKCAVVKNNGYCAQYILPSGNYLSQQAEFSVDSGASTGEIRKAFSKMLKQKAINKKFLTLFISHIA